ncbi:MAG: glycyl-radical enzyme activating protein [Spirochaetes bacterium]|nr:glycyl-radical enzyme activating protein [Spirochaetota bacterium]
MDEGLIFDIKRLSTDDGPGIRTTVFMKGCPLRCDWCASPESLTTVPEISFNEDKCVRCGLCATVCSTGTQKIHGTRREIAWENCSHCGECVRVCPSTALRMIGRPVTVEELVAEVEKDRTFFENSGGGVTMSGGEPTLQLDFLERFLACCRGRGIHTALDTTGYIEWSRFEHIVDLVDLFLYDLKHVDDEAHKKLTGVSNRRILENLKKLVQRGKNVIVRIPVIPDRNDTQKNISQSRDFISSLGIRRVDLLPFNKAAGSKYRLIGKKYACEDLQPLPDGKMNRIKAEFDAAGIETSIGR